MSRRRPTSLVPDQAMYGIPPSGGMALLNTVEEQYQVAAGETIAKGELVHLTDYDANPGTVAAGALLGFAGRGTSVVYKADNHDARMCWIDTDKALVARYDGSGAVYARVATVTPKTGAIALGAEVAVVASGAGLHLYLCKLDTNKALLLYLTGGNYVYALVLSASGTTVSVPGIAYQVSVDSAVSGRYLLSAAQIGTDKVIMIYSQSSSYPTRARVLSTSGSVVSAGSEVDVYSNSYSYLNVIALDTDLALICTRSTSDTYNTARVASVSGTTITLGAAMRTLYANTSAIKIASNKVVFWTVATAASLSSMRVGTISGTTITLDGTTVWTVGSFLYPPGQQVSGKNIVVLSVRPTTGATAHYLLERARVHGTVARGQAATPVTEASSASTEPAQLLSCLDYSLCMVYNGTNTPLTVVRHSRDALGAAKTAGTAGATIAVLRFQ